MKPSCVLNFFYLKALNTFSMFLISLFLKGALILKSRDGARNFPTKGLNSDEGAKIWFSGYYKCQKSPKKSCFNFRRGLACSDGGAIAP